MIAEEIRKQIADELWQAIGTEKVFLDSGVLRAYSNGGFREIPGLTNQWRFVSSHGDGGYPPDIVVRPTSTWEVAEIVKVANRRKIPLIPWSGATNFVGGDVALNGGVVVDLRDMNKILSIDADQLCATLQPGVRLMDLELALEKFGLRHGTFPGSALWATVGGALASDAHTLTGYKYGTLAENLLELEVVTPLGEVIRTGPWHSAGYNLRDLFTGSEGTLGVITQATVRVQRVQPCRMGMVLLFGTFADALQAHRKIWNSGFGELSTILTFDRFTSKFPQFSRPGVVTQPDGGILLTLEGRESGVQEAERAVRQIVESSGGHLLLERPGGLVDDWWVLLTVTNPLIDSGTGLEKADWKIGPHVWVPPDKVEVVRDTFERLVSERGMKYTGVVYTPTRLLVQYLYDHKDAKVCAEAYPEICAQLRKTVHQAGGTIAGAHGAGLAFKDEVRQVHGDSLDLMRRIKSALDPNGVMNPAKILD